MQATVARLELQPPDWGQVGAGVGSLIAAAAVAFLARFGSKKLGDGPPPEAHPPTGPIANAGTDAVTTLQGLINTLQGENQRLWARIGELEKRDEERDRHRKERDKTVREMQGQIDRLRALLVENRIDPGGER